MEALGFGPMLAVLRGTMKSMRRANQQRRNAVNGGRSDKLPRTLQCEATNEFDFHKAGKATSIDQWTERKTVVTKVANGVQKEETHKLRHA